MDSTFRHQVAEAVRFIHSKTSAKPAISLILGSGLGDFADSLEAESVIHSSDIPFYPASTVPGHAGTLVFGRVRSGRNASRSVLVFKGRVHFYESADLRSVVFPVIVAHRLGARFFLVTNAAGGINKIFRAGHLMLINDFINLTYLSPVSATSSFREDQHQGGYFDPRLQSIVRSAAIHLGIDLQEGTYCWLKGPSYETVAEIRMLQRMGADAVGMSTVPEIIAARSLGMRSAGISLISNMAAGISTQKLSHVEVTETAGRVKESFTSLLKEVIVKI